VVPPDRRHRTAYDGRARLERVHAGPERRDQRPREPPELGIEGSDLREVDGGHAAPPELALEQVAVAEGGFEGINASGH